MLDVILFGVLEKVATAKLMISRRRGLQSGAGESDDFPNVLRKYFSCIFVCKVANLTVLCGITYWKMKMLNNNRC